jgi:hypothetical protein
LLFSFLSLAAISSVQNQIGVLQYGSDADDFDFEGLDACYEIVAWYRMRTVPRCSDASMRGFTAPTP